MTAAAPPLARIPQLDGVRGVAIALVFLAHLLDGVYPTDRGLAPSGGWHPTGGGLIGVQLFFVLSGFLITRLLAHELEVAGHLDVKAFYVRRARRLLPALVLVCAAYAAWVVCMADRSAWPGAWGAIARALTYTANLDPVLAWLPDSHWLAHTWSLAVEEQFYLVWPLCLAVAWRFGRRGALVLALLGIVVTVALRALPGAERASYELLRWDALSLGCIVALWRPARLPWPAHVAGWLIVGYYFIHLPRPLHNLDYLVSSVGCVLFLLHALEATWPTHRLLGYLGTTSYGLYLWHILLLRTGGPPLLLGILSVGVAHLSFFGFERRLAARRSPAEVATSQLPARGSA